MGKLVIVAAAFVGSLVLFFMGAQHWQISYQLFNIHIAFWLAAVFTVFTWKNVSG